MNYFFLKENIKGYQESLRFQDLLINDLSRYIPYNFRESKNIKKLFESYRETIDSKVKDLNINNNSQELFNENQKLKQQIEKQNFSINWFKNDYQRIKEKNDLLLKENLVLKNEILEKNNIENINLKKEIKNKNDIIIKNNDSIKEKNKKIKEQEKIIIEVRKNCKMVMEDFNNCCEKKIKSIRNEYKNVDEKFSSYCRNEIMFGKEIRKLKEKNTKLNEKNYNLEKQLKYQKDSEPFNILKNPKKMKKIENNLIYKLKNGNKYFGLKFEIDEKSFLEDLCKQKKLEKIIKTSEKMKEKYDFFDLLEEYHVRRKFKKNKRQI